MAQANRGREKIPDEELFQALWDIADITGRMPTATEIELIGEYSYQTYRNRFGSLLEALWLAGFDTAQKARQRQKISTVELEREMNRLAEELGRSPTTYDMTERGEYSIRPYISTFGSWCKAQEACGLTPTQRGRAAEYDRETILEEIASLKEELGEMPTLEQIDEECGFSSGLVYKYFESKKEVEELLSQPKKFGEEEIHTIQKLLGELGRPPKVEEAAEALGTTEDALREEYEPVATLYRKAGIIFPR